MKKKNLFKLCIAGILIIFIIIFNIIKSNPNYADYYANHFSLPYINFIGNITSLVPFSLFEILFIIILISIIFQIVHILLGFKNKKWFSSLLTLSIYTLSILNFYIGTASVTYGRSEVDIPLIENSKINKELIEESLNYYVSDYNNISNHMERDSNNCIINPYSLKELSRIINEEYEKLENISNYFSTYKPLIKPLITSPLFTEFNITGITMSITGETHINNQIASCELPFTVAHEFAHAKGAYRENDANLVALYICINSENEFLRYSGYYFSIGSLMDAYNVTFRENYAQKYPLSNAIYQEINYIYSFWKRHNSLEKFATWWNDFYLKINGSKNGTDEYNDVSIKEETGEIDENGEEIIIISSYSPFQRLLINSYIINNEI